MAGFALTGFVVGPGAGHFARMIEGWEFSPRIGSVEIDPYTRARLFSEGEFPLAAGEGYALRASRDSEGNRLDSRCLYRLSSPFPTARYWTVTLSDEAGRLVPTLAERMGFTSAEIVRSADGRFSIEIGPEPLAGNWLPTSNRSGAFDIVLRFYETPLSATATRFDSRALPALNKLECPG